MKHPSRPAGIRRAILLGALVAALPAAADSLAGLAPGWVSPGLYTPEHNSWLTCRAGDVNGDGFDDIIMGVPYSNGGNGVLEIYYGGPTGPSTAGPDLSIEGSDPSFGWVVSRAGDVNDDGLGDIIVGAPGAAGGMGAVYIYAGKAGGPGPLPTWTAMGDGGGFGDTVMTAGNVDSNPGDEVIVGADLHTSPGGEEGFAYGHAYAYSVTAAGLTKVWDVDGRDYIAMDPDAVYVQQFGFAVSTAGDVNGDGYDDVIIGAPTMGYCGLPGDPRIQSRVYVFHGSATGLSTGCSWFQRRIQALSWMPNLGISATSAGDIDGDGYGDVIVGAPGTGVDYVGVVGEVQVYRGGASGLSPDPFWTVQGPEVSYYGIGTSAGCAGDFNGDGYRDVVVGNTNYMTYVYYGSAGGFPADPSETIDRRDIYSGGAWWPQTMYAGDINGDGSDDLLVAATGGDINGGPIPGSRAEIFYGTGVGMGDGDRKAGPKALSQSALGSNAAIAPGGIAIAPGVRLGARITGNGGGSMQVEVRPAGVAFQDHMTNETPTVSGGAIATVDIQLAPEQGYHWQARLHAGENLYSPWMPFGSAAPLQDDIDFRLRTNEAPVGSNPVQRNAETRATMGVGGRVYDRTPVRFEVDAADGHQDKVRLLVELRPLGEAFQGIATTKSDLAASGGKVGVDVRPEHGTFHWQWCLEDEYGAGDGVWTVFGGNAEQQPDFLVGDDGSAGTVCAASSSGGAGLGLALVLLAGMAAGFRRV